MSWGRSARAVRHVAASSRLQPAAVLLLAAACSGPTDIVGVVDGDDATADDMPAAGAPEVDPSPADARALDAASADADVALLLAGRPVTNWSGEALQWPLSTPLGELFAAAPGGRDRREPQLSAPWPSRRVTSGSARGLARRAGDVGARSPELDARLLILDEEEARRLLALMAPAIGASAERAAVFRDELGDVYLVSLESEEMSLDDAGCGRMRREPYECDGHGPFD